MRSHAKQPSFFYYIKIVVCVTSHCIVRNVALYVLLLYWMFRCFSDYSVKQGSILCDFINIIIYRNELKTAKGISCTETGPYLLSLALSACLIALCFHVIYICKNTQKARYSNFLNGLALFFPSYLLHSWNICIWHIIYSIYYIIQFGPLFFIF